MNRIRTLFLAALIAAAPMADAAAQDISPRSGSMDSYLRDLREDRARQDSQHRARQESQQGRRLSASEVARIVSRGREGRMVGISERNMGGNPGYVVRWEYPGGRVSDIMVDARTGSIMGER